MFGNVILYVKHCLIGKIHLELIRSNFIVGFSSTQNFDQVSQFQPGVVFKDSPVWFFACWQLVVTTDNDSTKPRRGNLLNVLSNEKALALLPGKLSGKLAQVVCWFKQNQTVWYFSILYFKNAPKMSNISTPEFFKNTRRAIRRRVLLYALVQCLKTS